MRNTDKSDIQNSAESENTSEFLAVTETVTDYADVVHFFAPRFKGIFSADMIQMRHLRAAIRRLNRSRSRLIRIQRGAVWLRLQMHSAAQNGLLAARARLGWLRAVKARSAQKRIAQLKAYYQSIEAERMLHVRIMAAARTLLFGWEEKNVSRPIPALKASRKLRNTILLTKREERLARNRLSEVELAEHQMNAAHEALNQNYFPYALNPEKIHLPFNRRKYVTYVFLLLCVIAAIAFFYPPWNLPNLGVSCSNAGKNIGCASLPVTSAISLRNTGSGAITGWVSVSANMYTRSPDQILPVFILPNHTQIFTCDSFNICTNSFSQPIYVSITTSGGAYNTVIQP